MSPTEKPTKPVAIYTRVSEQGRRSDEELISHELQRERVEQYLAAKSIPVSPEIFADTDRSGGTMSRPAFDRAVSSVLEGHYGGIAVARLSRFGRTTSGVLDLIAEIEKTGRTVICLDPQIDTSSASGRAMLTVFLAFVTMEREQAIEQADLVAEKKLQALARGELGAGLGGRPPVGYEFEITGRDANGKPLRGKLVPNADAPTVRAAFELVASGGSCGQAADLLNAAGVRTAQGNPWRSSAVRGRILEGEVYTGVRVYGDRRVEGAHEPIVPPWLWRKAVKRLTPTGAPVKKTRGEGHVLGEGLVRCGLCGGGLVKSHADGRYRTLRCLGRGRGHATIMYDKAAAHIVSKAIEHIGLVLSEMHLGGEGAEIEAAEARLAQTRRDLAELEAAEDELSPLAFGRALDKARAAVEQAEDALAALDRSQAWWMQPHLLTIAGGNRLAFDALSVPDKRRFLHEQIARAILTPGRGAPEERIEIEWAHEAGPREIEGEDWTVLEFSEQAGLAFKGVPPDAPITSEILDTLREQAVAELRRGAGLRRRATAAQLEAGSDTAARKAK